MPDDQQNECKNCSIVGEVKAIHRGMYGDSQNKTMGLMKKVDCLLEYKSELKFVRAVKNYSIKVLVGVLTTAMGGYIVWTYFAN